MKTVVDRTGLWVFGLWVLLLGAIAATSALAVAQDAALERENVAPDINERWKSDDIDALVETLDRDTREIFAQRERIADLVAPRPGMAVADIGAGSGFMAEEFARRVGGDGKVYAVDINAHMMERVATQAASRGLEQIETVVCAEDDVRLPADSVELAFICDTYHHFEYPAQTLASLHGALRENGELVVVDFVRDADSPEWVLNHVRAGKDTFVREIESAGFAFVEEHDAGFLSQNYVVRFRKVAGH